MSLEEEALKFYYNSLISLFDPPLTEKITLACHNLHYIPPFLNKDDDYYIHTDSVVSYCHRFGNEKFIALTRKSFNKKFSTFKIITKGGTSHSFRIIKKGEFERICK